MNFLAEVLYSAETIEISEINQKVPKLKQMVDNLKIKIVKYTENVYIKQIDAAHPVVNKNLLNETRNLQEEIKKLSKNAESATKNGVSKANEKLTEHLQILNTVSVIVKALSDICEINEKLNNFTVSMHDNQFYKCRQIINDMECIIMEIPEDEDLLVIDKHGFGISAQCRLLSDKIVQCFHEKVVVEKEGNSASIKIFNEIRPLDQALLAMYYNQSSVFILSEFTGFLWKNLFVSIVDYVVEVKVDTNDSCSTLNLSIINPNKKSPYKEVFSQLILVLEFLNTNFNFPLTDLEGSLTTLEYIGSDIQDNLFKLIIKDCLEDTISSTVEGLQNYKEVIQDTVKLESVLRETKIFSPQTASLQEFVNKIDFHYFNKKCREYLLKSQMIMKKNLHDLIEVGEPYDPENSIDAEIKYFSQCSISISVIELLDYCKKLLQQAVEASNKYTFRLVITCQSILRRYASFVPEYHSELLKTIPQQVALFHNNCFYISYNLTKWKGDYILKMPSKLNVFNNVFDAEVRLLRLAGSETFGAYLKSQIKEIKEIMKNSGLDAVTLEGELKPVTRKSIQQCLKQQEMLKTVWHKVLPYQIYNKTLGIIINTLCACLITSIINFKDISSKAAEQLEEIIEMIISRGPELFTDPKKVNLYVKCWCKLNELNFVLGASLLDINDRWANGKGSLALQFNPVELKMMIRALFSDSDKRAAVLIKI